MRWITSTALLLAFVAAALLFAQCERGPDSSTASGPLAEELVAPAPWELAHDPSEFVATVHGVAHRPLVAADGSESTGYAVGATLELWTVDPYGIDLQREIARTTVGPEGRFEIGPAPTDHWAVRLSQEGHGPSLTGEGVRILGVGGADDALPLEIGMRPGRPVEGKVFDAGGLPVAEVRVRAHSMAYFEETRTDTDGKFRLTMPRGESHVWIADPRWESARTTYDPEAGSDRELGLWTDAREPVRGWVVDTSTGRRVAGAVVQSVEDPRVRTRTDDDGRFELSLPERQSLAAFADGLGWRSVTVPEAGEVEIRLTPAPTVVGRVLDQEGRPVEAARVVGVTTGVEARTELVTGPLTDAEGRFTCTWLPPGPRGVETGTHWFVRRRGMGRTPATALEDSTDPIELRLSGLRSIEGRVRRNDGRPLAGAEVEVRWEAPDLPDRQASAAAVAVGRRTLVGDDGRYVLREVPADRELEVVVSAWGVDVGEVVAAGGGTATLDVAFPAGDPLSGRVLDVHGRPVAAEGIVRASLLRKGDERLAVRRTARLEADGSFHFADLPPGPYQLLAEFDGYTDAGLVVPTGTDDAEFRLTRPGSVTVSVGLPTGTPEVDGPQGLPSATLVPLERGEALPNTETMEPTERGWSVRFAPVREGVYEVRVDAGLWRARVERFDVGDGLHAELDLELRRTRGVTIELVDQEGTPVAGELIVMAPARPGPGLHPQNARTGPDGRASLAGLAAGTWRVRVLAADSPPHEEELEIGPDVADDVDAVRRVVLPEGGNLRVEAFDANGAPLAGAIVRAKSPDGDEVYFQTRVDAARRSIVRVGAEGRVDLSALPTGPVLLVLEVDGGETTREVEVRAGETIVVRF